MTYLTQPTKEKHKSSKRTKNNLVKVQDTQNMQTEKVTPLLQNINGITDDLHFYFIKNRKH